MQLEIQAPAFKEIQKDFDRKTQEQIIEKLAYFAQNYESIIQTKKVENDVTITVYYNAESLDKATTVATSVAEELEGSIAGSCPGWFIFVKNKRQRGICGFFVLILQLNVTP